MAYQHPSGWVLAECQAFKRRGFEVGDHTYLGGSVRAWLVPDLDAGMHFRHGGARLADNSWFSLMVNGRTAGSVMARLLCCCHQGPGNK